jgi:hypothetical protein
MVILITNFQNYELKQIIKSLKKNIIISIFEKFTKQILKEIICYFDKIIFFCFISISNYN